MSEYIKSPLNYIGGKYKLLPQILPLFPSEINIFVDLFTGGSTVGINVKANHIVCNDILKPIIDFYRTCQKYTDKEMIAQIEELIKKYQLSETNKEGYLNLRKFYNDGNKTWDVFYMLTAHSNTNMIRFNKNGDFNVPFGKRTFNDNLREKFITFANYIKLKTIDFTSVIFTSMDFCDFCDFDNAYCAADLFFYCDPPYLITNANYNENGGWGIEKEKSLLQILDFFNNKNIKFALSNVLEHKGKSNDILKEWSKKYNVHELKYNYSNCNYNVKDRSKDSSREVLITNY